MHIEKKMKTLTVWASNHLIRRIVETRHYSSKQPVENTHGLVDLNCNEHRDASTTNPYLLLLRPKVPATFRSDFAWAAIPFSSKVLMGNP